MYDAHDGIPLTEDEARRFQDALLQEFHIVSWIATDGEQWALIAPEIGDGGDRWLWSGEGADEYMSEYRDYASDED